MFFDLNEYQIFVTIVLHYKTLILKMTSIMFLDKNLFVLKEQWIVFGQSIFETWSSVKDESNEKLRDKCVFLTKIKYRN